MNPDEVANEIKEYLSEGDVPPTDAMYACMLIAVQVGQAMGISRKKFAGDVRTLWDACSKMRRDGGVKTV